MSKTRLTKIQRKELMGILVLTIMGSVGIWLFVVTPLEQALEGKRYQIVEAQTKTETAKRGVELADRIERDHEVASFKLELAEETMAQGDAYRWIIRTMRNLAPTNKVEIITYDPPHDVGWTFYPRVPYNLATISVSGNAFFQDLGLFLAEVENTIPTMRIERLDMDATRGEKMNFRLSWVTLAKPQQ